MSQIKVRIAVAVDKHGEWGSAGWGGPKSTAKDADKMGCAVENCADGEARYWLEAWLDLPEDTQAVVVTPYVLPALHAKPE